MGDRRDGSRVEGVEGEGRREAGKAGEKRDVGRRGEEQPKTREQQQDGRGRVARKKKQREAKE
jgi:hypothetical protein